MMAFLYAKLFILKMEKHAFFYANYVVFLDKLSYFVAKSKLICPTKTSQVGYKNHTS